MDHWLLALPLLGGLLFRIRGGLWGDAIRRFLPIYGTQWGRSAFALPTSLLMAFLASSVWLIPFGYLSTFLSLSTIGWASYMCMGREELADKGTFDFIVGTETKEWSFKKKFMRDYAGLTLRHLYTMILLALPLYLLHTVTLGSYMLMVLSGAMIAPIYAACWKWIPTRQTEWAEAFTGAWIWFVLITLI